MIMSLSYRTRASEIWSKTASKTGARCHSGINPDMRILDYTPPKAGCASLGPADPSFLSEVTLLSALTTHNSLCIQCGRTIAFHIEEIDYADSSNSDWRQ